MMLHDQSFSFKDVIYQGLVVEVPVSPYHYSSLIGGSDEFRLLQVMPTSDTAAPVQCKLEHYRSSDNVYYTALSYECGDPSDYRVIEVDGIPFPVTSNLDKAIRQLRAHGCPLLWIDSICIHQTNDTEKDEQIQSMKHIYNRAESVAVWLGEESGGSCEIMRIIRAIDLSRKADAAKPRKPWLPNRNQLESIEMMLAEFFLRTYWRRVWIIQEIALGVKVTIFCGTEFAAWRGLELLVDETMKYPQLRLGAEQVQRLCQTRSERVLGKPSGLLQLLYYSTSALATDPRDKLYALSGLAADWSHFVTTPHYAWDMRRICMTTTEDFVRRKQSLDIIFAAYQRGQQQLSLPTWCPNYLRWPHTPVAKALADYLSGQNQRYRLGKLSYRWHTTNHELLPSHGIRILNGSQLLARGLLLGHIVNLGFQHDESEYAARFDIVSAEDSLCNDLRLDTSDAEIFRRLSRAMVLYRRDAVPDHEKDVDWNYAILFHAFYTDDGMEKETGAAYRRRTYRNRKPLRDWCNRNRNFMIKHKTLRQRAMSIRQSWNGNALMPALSRLVIDGVSAIGRLQGASYRMPLATDIGDALDDLQDIIEEGMRLMHLSNDHFGWAHPESRLGDRVFLIAGCSMPVIVRPLEDRSSPLCHSYGVIGHAYVEGAMDGTIWAHKSEESLEHITLV